MAPAVDSTAFIATWDDPGGFYDHVPPPMSAPPPDHQPACFCLNGERTCEGFGPYSRLGRRVPVLVVSPWVPEGFCGLGAAHEAVADLAVRRDLDRRHGQAVV